MESSSAWQTALTILGSIGSAGVIIAAIVKWSADRIAEQIIKRKDYEFSQKLVELKSSFEKKNYISKVRFDLEIDIYRQLSEATLKMVQDCSVLWPLGLSWQPADKDSLREKEEVDLNEAINSFNFASNAILRHAPFIPADMYSLFLEIKNECHIQIQMKTFIAHEEKKSQSFVDPSNISEFKGECWQRTKEINDKLALLIEKLRAHITNFDVLND